MNKLLLLLLLPFMLNAINYELTVPANVEWFNSEISVSIGEQVIITSEGLWQYDPRPNFKTGPDGLVNEQLSLGALQMKCNDNVYLVGSSWEGVMLENCILKFGMYDNIGHANNVGSLEVHIKIEKEYEEELNEENNDNGLEENEISEEEIVESEEEKYENEICSLAVFLILLALGASYVYEKK